jgi:hypothetical protein
MEMKYTKTATFLFPLLNISKNLFDCNILDNWGRIKYKSRFLNAYLADSNIPKFNDKGYVFVVCRSYRDLDFERFYSTIQAFPNYVDDYDNKDYVVFVFSIPEEHQEDYKLILEGKYSKISLEAKRLILGNNYFSDKALVLPLILNKAIVLKDHWEKRLSNPWSIAVLGEQEVWPIISINKEILTKEVADLLVLKKSLHPSGEFG